MHYADWMHTKHRPYRYTRWGMINDPDCEQGDESTFWLDRCADPKSTGVLGYRKYFKEPERDAQGKVIFDPRSTPYTEGEMESQRLRPCPRINAIGISCTGIAANSAMRRASSDTRPATP